MSLVGQHATVLDLGAGTGHYVRHMRARGLIADGVDGVRNIGELSGGVVSFRELTVPFGAGCSQYDWAMSLEVGEHIPHEHEHTFLENLNCSCRMGLILSWAQPGQPGAGHVNARRRRSLHALLGEYSLVVQRNATRSLSLAANLTWLRYNVLVFVRGHYTPAPPPPPRPPRPLRSTNFERECYIASMTGEKGLQRRRSACRSPSDPCGPLACANLSATNISAVRALRRRTCGRTRAVANAAELMPLWRTVDDSVGTGAHACMGHVLSDGCDPRVRTDGVATPGTSTTRLSSAFERVALVVAVRSKNDLVLVLHYAAWFAGITLLVGDANVCVACRTHVVAAGNATATAAAGHYVECACLLHEPDGYARAMAITLRKHAPGDLVGVMYLHAEFGLNPRRFGDAGVPLNDIWIARGGLASTRYQDPCCYPANSTKRCAVAAKALGLDECCVGWSDMIYMPFAAISAFVRLTSLPQIRTIAHETAIPTVINALVRNAGAGKGAVSTSHTGHHPAWRLLPRCQGSRTTRRLEMQQLWAVHDGHCGHRYDLTGPYQRRWFGHLIQYSVDAMAGRG